MKEFTIYLGSPCISSWSMRAWLMLKTACVDFDEVIIEKYVDSIMFELINFGHAKKSNKLCDEKI